MLTCVSMLTCINMCHHADMYHHAVQSQSHQPSVGFQLVNKGCCDAGHSLISDIIDFEQSEEGMMISYSVCDQLDEMKHTYHGLPDFLTKVTSPCSLCSAHDTDIDTVKTTPLRL